MIIDNELIRLSIGNEPHARETCLPNARQHATRGLLARCWATRHVSPSVRSTASLLAPWRGRTSREHPPALQIQPPNSFRDLTRGETRGGGFGEPQPGRLSGVYASAGPALAEILRVAAILQLSEHPSEVV